MKRSEKVIRKLSEEGGKSMRKIMNETGYSKSYSDNPQKLTKTKTWKSLMEKYFPDEELAKVHKRMLHSGSFGEHRFPLAVPLKKIKKILRASGLKFIDSVEAGAETLVYFVRYDNGSAGRALEMAYRVKDKNAPDKMLLPPTTGLDSMSDEELAAEAVRYQKRLGLIKGAKSFKKEKKK